MKCWHCGNKTRTAESAFIKFAVGEEWQEKRVWLCSYCAQNLKKGFNKQKLAILKEMFIVPDSLHSKRTEAST